MYSSIELMGNEINEDKQMSMASSDRISELPDEILCHILSFLTVEDAFALKLQSRRWRRLQVPLSNLYFNQTTMFGTVYSHSYLERHLTELQSEFCERVDWFLKLFRGPHLNSFGVDFCLDNDFASTIDNWVSFAVRMEAESIELDFYSSQPFPRRTCTYNFPFHLLPKPKPSGKVGPRLKHLKLSSCLLLLTPPPQFQSQSLLNCLKTLDLQHLPLDQSGLDGVLSSCLDLEWLTLKECQLPWTLRICSGRLKGLRVHWCWETDAIELNAAQLQAFEYKGRSVKLSFLVVPRCLQRVHLGLLNPYAEGAILDPLAKDLPELQILSLFWFTAYPIPASITGFRCLKQLDFFAPEYIDFDLLSVTYILNACPMLQKFHLAMKLCVIRDERPKPEKVVYSKNIKYLHLEEIEIRGFRWTRNEVKLVTYLLNNAVALKRMAIIYSQWLSDDYKWRNVDRASCDLPTMNYFKDMLRKEMISDGAELIVC